MTKKGYKLSHERERYLQDFMKQIINIFFHILSWFCFLIIVFALPIPNGPLQYQSIMLEQIHPIIACHISKKGLSTQKINKLGLNRLNKAMTNQPRLPKRFLFALFAFIRQEAKSHEQSQNYGYFT